MWLLILILHGQPYQVKRIEVVQTYFYRQGCERDIKRMVKHLKKNHSMGCVPLLEVKKV